MLLSLPVPTTPISAFFALFMAVPLLPTHPPTFIYCMPLFSHSSYLLHDPSHSPTPAWPLPPHFRFFCIFYGCPPTTNTFPHYFTLYNTVSPFPNPNHPPCLQPPSPPFCCFHLFMDAFLCIFISYSVCVCTHMFISTGYICFDRFFGCNQLPGQGK